MSSIKKLKKMVKLAIKRASKFGELYLTFNAKEGTVDDLRGYQGAIMDVKELVFVKHGMIYCFDGRREFPEVYLPYKILRRPHIITRKTIDSAFN